MKLTKPAILLIFLLNTLMNVGIVPVLSHISQEFPDASPTLLKMTLSNATNFFSRADKN